MPGFPGFFHEMEVKKLILGASVITDEYIVAQINPIFKCGEILPLFFLYSGQHFFMSYE